MGGDFTYADGYVCRGENFYSRHYLLINFFRGAVILLIADGYVCRGELRSPAWNFVESNGRPMVAPTDYEENFLFSIIKFWYWICIKLRLNQWADILQIAGGSLPLAPAKRIGILFNLKFGLQHTQTGEHSSPLHNKRKTYIFVKN